MRPSAASIPVLLSIALAYALACGQEEQPAVEEPVLLAVKTLTIGGADSRNTREYTGSLAAWQHSEMAFEVSGKIIEFRAVEGERVEAGYVLARLDPRDFQNNLAAARAERARARAFFERVETAANTGAISQQDLTDAKARYEQAKARTAVSKKALEDSLLRAPFTGVMARKLVEDFQNVTAKERVLILQDDTHFKIRVTVPEQDMTGGTNTTDLEVLSRALKPAVVVSSLPDRRFPARFHELSLTADPVTRTFDATFVMDKPGDVTVFPGMTAKVIVHTTSDGESGGSVPGVAVWADEAGTSYVWRVDPQTNRASRVAVELGPLTGDRVQIRSGLSPGDVIATSGIQKLSEGAAVRPLGERLR